MNTFLVATDLSATNITKGDSTPSFWGLRWSNIYPQKEIDGKIKLKLSGLNLNLIFATRKLVYRSTLIWHLDVDVSPSDMPPLLSSLLIR